MALPVQRHFTRRLRWMTCPPVTGYWNVGNIFFSSSAVAGLPY